LTVPPLGPIAVQLLIPPNACIEVQKNIAVMTATTLNFMVSPETRCLGERLLLVISSLDQDT
jgi:hypothetical protein